MSTGRGVATSIRWQAQCKDCGRHDDPAGFDYPDPWIESVVERGGSRSDRCPSCRQKHARDARSMAVPYIDVKTLGEVADRDNPTGPLGGLGPLPVEHERNVVDSDLSRFDFGLVDDDVRRLLTGLENKQVAIVVAGTGSGKSTFLPYRLLVPPADATLHLADRGPIIVTEPRVFATIDVATFIATQLHRAPAVGPGCDIGYRVKGKPAFDSSCRLLFVTDGSLINWLRDGSLDKFGAVVIDEAHERSKNIDVILALLRTELPKQPHLRVIVLSATIDAAFFREYFGGEKKVVVLDDIKVRKQWGYGNPLWPDDPIELDHADWAVGKEFRGKPIRDIAAHLAGLRVLKGREIPVAAWRDQMPQLVADQAVAIAGGTDWGDVLAFLPGEAAIDAAVGDIREQLTALGLNEKWDVYGLLRSTLEDEQRAARCEREEGDNRRIVVSTNIAETSLTIDGVTYVVDSGLINQSQWDVATASKSIPAVPHSKSGVRQRWGRVGRKAPGWVFPLYTRDQFKAFHDHTPPEAVRDDLEALVLTAKAAGIDDPTEFVWPAAFEPRGATEDKAAARLRAGFQCELKRATAALKRRGAIDEEDGDITPWGAELLSFSGTPAEAGAVAGADELACAIEATTAITLLGGSALIGPKGILLFDEKWTPTARNVARRLHESMMIGCEDELDLALKVYGAWERTGDPEAWAKANCVNHELLEKASETRAERLEFLSPGRKSPVSQPVRLQLAPRVRAVLSRALVDFTFVNRGDRWVSAESEGVDYQLSKRSHLDGADRVISLRRSAADGRAYLSGLVVSYEWAADIGSWTELALEASERLRDTDGELPGLTTEEALMFQDEWSVGARVCCSFGSDGQVTAAELIAPPPPDPLSVREIEEREPDLDGELMDAEAIELVEETPVVAAQGRADLVGVLQAPDEVLLNPEMEPQFEDVAELEVDETDEQDTDSDRTSDEGDGQQAEQAAGALLAPGPLESRPHVKVDSGEDVRSGDHVLRVVGYEGLGANRVVLAIVESDGNEPEVDLIKAREAREARALELVHDWGPTFLVAQDLESGLDVCVPGQELTLSADEEDVVIPMEHGASLGITPLKFQDAHAAILGTRVPELQLHFKEAESITPDGTSISFHAATVASRRHGTGFIHLHLVHTDERRGLLHQFSVGEGLLKHNGIPVSEGVPLMVELKPQASRDASGWIVRPLARLPEGLAKLCDDEHLAYQLASPTLLRAAPGMSPAARDDLLALSSSKAWRLAVKDLWRTSSGAGAGHDDTLGWVIRAIPKAPPGLAELCDDATLQLDPGQVGVLKAAPGMTEQVRDRLLDLSDQGYWHNVVHGLWRDSSGETEATTNPDGWFERRFNSVPQGLARLCDDITVAYQEPRQILLLAAPDMSEELRDELITLNATSNWQAAIRKLWEESNGERVLSVGSDGWAQRLVPEAPDRLEDLLGEDLGFVQGHQTSLRAAPLMSVELRDSLLALSDDPNWQGTIGKVWSQTNGLRVSAVAPATKKFEERLRADKLRALLATLQMDRRVTGTVTEVQVLRIKVELKEVEGIALLHKTAMGDFGVDDASRYFAVGDEISAEIKDVGIAGGNEQILLAIRGRDLELEAARSRFAERDSFEGTVTNLVKFGLFVELGGMTGLVRKTAIGSGGGVVDPSKLFSIGETVSGQVDNIRRGKNDRLEINLSMPDLEVPPLLDQVREVYPVGATERGRLTGTTTFGAFISLRHDLSGLVSNQSMGSDDRARLASLKVGDPIEVVVTGVRMGKRRVEIDLRFA